MPAPRSFYVYTLTDPRDGAVFYVGKGTGQRMYGHLREAQRPGQRGNVRKLERIRAILAAGLEPKAERLAEYESEQDAFEHEADLIATMPGLTNILARGGGWALAPEEYERRALEREARVLSRARDQLRSKLAVWDEWIRRGYEITVSGVRLGDELAAQIAGGVRELIAEADLKIGQVARAGT